MRLLDVGCGPGTITIGLAQRVAPGVVTGIDVSETVLDQARANAAAQSIRNPRFEAGSVYEIDADDGSFDVTHAHQVLQHLSDPVAALTEMARVTRPGGLVAVRDADYGTMVHAPDDPRLHRWLELYHQVALHNDAEPDAGRHLLSWCRAAGLTRVTISTDTWTFADDASRRNWGESWSQRILTSSVAEQAIEYDLATRAELEAISQAWLEWSQNSDGYFAFLHTNALAIR